MRRVALLLLLLVLSAGAAQAQVVTPVTVAKQTAMDVGLNPMTYLPAVAFWIGTSRDWRTSQRLFGHGYIEINPTLTVSGWSKDTPVSYARGQAIYRRQTAKALIRSAVINTGASLSSQLLVYHQPTHKKLIRASQWTATILINGAMGYYLSAPHFRQAGRNIELATSLGL